MTSPSSVSPSRPSITKSLWLPYPSHCRWVGLTPHLIFAARRRRWQASPTDSFITASHRPTAWMTSTTRSHRPSQPTPRSHQRTHQDNSSSRTLRSISDGPGERVHCNNQVVRIVISLTFKYILQIYAVLVLCTLSTLKSYSFLVEFDQGLATLLLKTHPVYGTYLMPHFSPLLILPTRRRFLGQCGCQRTATAFRPDIGVAHEAGRTVVVS